MAKFGRRKWPHRSAPNLCVERLEDRRLLAGIKGFVWNDWNQDGRKADKEVEHIVSDVQVNLLDANTGDVVKTDSTDRKGAYEFPEIDPGEYIVEFIPQDDVEFTQPDVGAEKKDSDALPVNGRTRRISVQGQDTLTGVNAGIFSPVSSQSIHGRVWNDINVNGIQDSGEPGVGNFEVQVENLFNNKLYEVDTDVNGNFAFDGERLLSGVYQLEFKGLSKDTGTIIWKTSPSGALDGSVPHLDSDLVANDRTAPFEVRSLSNDVDDVVSLDAGLFQSAQIVGSIWHDTDRNGSRGDHENGVERYAVNLLSVDGQPVDRTLSDLNGDFHFNVRRGDYIVHVETPRQVVFARTDNPIGGIGSDVNRKTGRSEVLSISGQGDVYHVSVGVMSNEGTRDLTGRVWHDINANGIQDPHEPGFDDAEVELENSAFVELLEVETDANGFFRIDGSLLLPGSSYHLHYKEPETGMRVGPRNAHGNEVNDVDNDAQPTNHRTSPIDLLPLAETGNAPLRQDAGFYLTTTIDGGVWDDKNGNGIRSLDEHTVAGVTVELLGSGFDVLATARTDEEGLYHFNGVTPGDEFRVRVAPFPNVEFTKSESGATSRVSSLNPSTGVSIPFPVGSKASRELWAGVRGVSGETGIQGAVWDDLNGNGIREQGERGIAGVNVKAFSDGRRYETETDQDGVYRFVSIRPGQYKLDFQQLEGSTFSPLNRGTDPTSDSDVNRWTKRTEFIPVVSGQIHEAIDAAVYRGSVGKNALDSIRLTEIASIAHGEIEFVEIKNIGDEPVSLEGVRFVDGVSYNFSTSSTTSLFPGEYVVVYGDEHDQKHWPQRDKMNIAGQYSLDLNQEERLTLVDANSKTIASVAYDDDWFVITDDEYLPWSLTAIDETAPREAFSSRLNWRPSSQHGGSPSASDPLTTPNPGAVVINEVLTKSSDGFNDLIELYNRTDSDIDIGYWFLGDYDGGNDDPTDTLTRYRIAPGTVIPAGGYLTFSREKNFASEEDLGTNSQFGLSSYGESLHLVAADEYGEMLGYSDSVEFAGTDIDIAYGRVELSNGGSAFVVMAEPTFGGSNSEPAFSPVVIDQVMYSVDNAIPYIRIQNVSDVDIERWSDSDNQNSWLIGGTIDYRFTRRDLGLAAGEYAFVVASEPRYFRDHYQIPSHIPVYGPFQSSLGRRQGVVSLFRPGLENRMLLADQIQYSDTTPWPSLSRDVALTRKSPYILGEDPAAWIDSERVLDSVGSRHQGQNLFVMNAFSTSAPVTLGHDALSVAVRPVQPGDANGDGLFNSRDLVQVFQTAKYGTEAFASWFEGDWDGDGFFDSSDFVAAFRHGGYETGQA